MTEQTAPEAEQSDEGDEAARQELKRRSDPGGRNPHGRVVKTGRHAGVRFTRAPIGYLRRLARHQGQDADLARQELERRGVSVSVEVEQQVTPVIAPIALDQASQYLVHAWEELGQPNEGFGRWLMRLATEAWQHGQHQAEGERLYQGVVFEFDQDRGWPALQGFRGT